MLVKQSYKYDVSPEYSFTVEFLQEETSLYSNKAGFQNVDYMPLEGTTVTIYSNVIGTAGEVDFKPSMGNKFYWLVSNDLLTDRDEIIVLANSLVSSLVSGRYQATFVFSNPNNFRYLYIISDYTNSIPSLGDAEWEYSPAQVEVIDYLSSPAAGIVTIEFTGTDDTRVVAEYNDVIVADSGVTAAGSGSIQFTKATYGRENIRIMAVNEGLVKNTILVKEPITALTPFYIDTANGTLSNVCSQAATTQMYHNGSSSLPVAGNIIYTDSGGLTAYDGGNAYHVISTVSMGAPSASSAFAAVLTDGTVSAVGTCACSEIAVPVITQTDVTVTQNQYFSMSVEASNNPTSWDLVTTCNEYLLDGGARGGTFTYTDCNGDAKKATSGSDQQQVVCASALPIVASGTGSVTLQGPCAENSLPTGIEFKDGLLFGKPTSTGRTTITVNATNCFGTSVDTAFDVVVEASYNLIPFGINTLEPDTTGAAACSLGGSYDILYHNGRGELPTLNNTVYVDQHAVKPFVGGKQWFMLEDSLYSVQIDELGTVIDTHTC